jgi:hypothetical protein
MTTNPANKYIQELQKRGPVAWAQGPHGWITPTGAPVILETWQAAVLDAWFECRADVSTLAISNVKKTGKTFVNAVLLAWRWLALPGQHFAAGNDLDQSQARQFQEITDMVRRNPFLSENVRVSKMELEFTLTGSKLTALAADAAGNAGANHLTVSHTEAWGILYEAGIRSWEELTPPPGATYGLPALRIVDSYAGFVGESQTWHKVVDRGLKGALVSNDWPVYLIGGLMLFHAEGTEAQERCFRGSESQRAAYYAEQAESLRENAYSRMHENKRTSGESAFVTTEQWQACYSGDVRPLGDGEQVDLFLGADASQKHDYTALIGTAKGDYTDVRFVKVWKPKKGLFGKNEPIDLEKTIGAEVLRLHKARQVRAVCYDPWQLATVAKQWERAGIKCIEMPQTNQRTEADTALYDAIVTGRLRHFNNAELTDAVTNAVVMETPRGMRIAKEKASKKIDALVALSMSNHAAVTAPVYGNIQSIPNPFYGDNPPLTEYIEVSGRMVHVPTEGRKPHPPGVTWRNCRHKNKGCEACVREMDQEGIFQRDREELELSLARGAGQAMSEAEANEELKSRLSITWQQEQQQIKEYQDAQVISKFWNTVRGKLGS